jgi:hypothetical protein
MAQYNHKERRNAALVVASRCVKDRTGAFDCRSLLDMLGLLDADLREQECPRVRRRDLVNVPLPFVP